MYDDDDISRRPLDQAGLDQLRSAVPHATLEDVADPKEGADPRVIEDLRSYFHRFAKPTMPNHTCLRCGRPLTGGLAAVLMDDGGFEWGLAHGHGHCRKCGWPATAYHFIKDRDGNDLMTVRGVVLQIHPDDIELREGRRG